MRNLRIRTRLRGTTQDVQRGNKRNDNTQQQAGDVGTCAHSCNRTLAEESRIGVPGRGPETDGPPANIGKEIEQQN